jgi:large subunit ribosomal protein L24
MAHVKTGDEVVVITGSAKIKGKSGKVASVLTKKNRVIVEGLNLRKKAVPRSQENPQGGIIEVEGSIHISNLMKKDEYDARRAKQGKN